MSRPGGDVQVLTLRLLGPPTAEGPGLAGGRVALLPEAPLWLLSFLACQDGPVDRGEVLELLYPDVDPPAARNRLRNLLHRVRQAPWGSGLEASAAHLRWRGDTDVRAFRQACRSSDWTADDRTGSDRDAALDAGAGRLLDGLRPAELPAVSAWLDAEQEDLDAAWLDAALQRALHLERSGDAASARSWLERLLARHPYAEDAVQAALRCAALEHDAPGAAHVYERFRRQLDQDLGLQPATATTALYRAVVAAPGARVAAPPPGPRRPAGPLFGRQDELDWIGGWLTQPPSQPPESPTENRVLTLAGPGGAGKTRLSLEVLGALPPGLTAVFAPLEAVHAAAAVLPALAQALGLPPGGGAPLDALLTPLRQRPHLLVLDNLEQLLAPGERAATLNQLTALLDAAPTLRLLVTSRVRLGLLSEQVVHVGGLAYPPVESLPLAARSSAVRLFVERAARVRPGFALNAQNAADLVRLCQLTEGLPLALELTAAWMGTFEPRDLVAELGRDLDVLESGAPDRPERHRSLRAAFLHSWQLLDAGERQVLAALSVFRGGFERAAAAAVGGGLRALLMLADHSLLRREGSGRYALHEVVRQYAAEQLDRGPEAGSVRAAHAAWYLAQAVSAARRLHGPEQVTLLHELSQEHDNLRAALRWLQTRGEAAPLLTLATALSWFWYVRGHHREGLSWLTAALALPGTTAAARAAALCQAGALARELGEYERGARELNEALTLAREAGDEVLEAQALHGLGLQRREQGDLDSAEALFLRAEQLQRALSEPWALSTTLNDLGIVWAFRHDEPRARACFQESLTLKRRLGDVQGVAYALANLGNVSDDDGYERLTRQSLELKRELGDRQGVANSLYNLADLHLNRGETAAARPLLKEALELYWALGRAQRLAATLTEFAKLAAAEGQPLRCLQLAGAAETLLTSLGLSGPAQPFQVGAGLDDALAATGEEGRRHFLQGASMSLAAAVDLARGAP